MKLYYDPVSTTSRPICLMAADAGIALDTQVISLLSGETRTEAFRAINPMGQIPVLADGDFVLTECAAILKYLAEHHAPHLYATEMRQRARIDEAVAWLSSDVHLWLDVMTVYPRTLLPLDSQVASAMATLAAPKVDTIMAVLNDKLQQHAFIAGAERSIADYLGISFITLAELIAMDFAPWPAITRWIAAMKGSQNWDHCFGGFYGLLSAMRAGAPPN